MSYFIDTSKLRRKQLTPIVTMRSMWGENVMVNIIENAPHSVVARHSHPHEQVGIVLEGEFDMTIGDETRRLKPWDAYVIPGGVEHSANGLDSPALSLDIFSPPREEFMD